MDLQFKYNFTINNDEQGAKFMYNLTFLVYSEMTQGMYLSDDRRLYL